MSVQDSRDQFERESVEGEIEESQDFNDQAPLTDSDPNPSGDSESVDVPEIGIPSENSTTADESDEPVVPAIESMPVSSSDELPAPEPAEGPAWYVIHCYSGYENKVRHNLEQRIETMGMKDRIFDVVIPTQEEIEVKDGKRRTVERHIFPGYVLVNMVLTEESWYVVRNTPGVTGFVGMGNNPTPLRPEEVAQIVKRMEAEAPTVKVTFKVGERVRIIDGPFNDFRGVVSEIDMERTKVRVMVSFFGRETPVELDFLQVEKA
jgi:transcriptional antiterminator NusG